MSPKWYIWEDIVDAVDAISKSCVGRHSHHGRSPGQWHVEKTGEVVGGKSNGSVLRGAQINDEWWRTKCDKKLGNLGVVGVWVGEECERIWAGQGGAAVVREGPLLLGIHASKIRSCGQHRFPTRIEDTSSSTKSPPSGKLGQTSYTWNIAAGILRWSSDIKLYFWSAIERRLDFFASLLRYEALTSRDSL